MRFALAALAPALMFGASTQVWEMTSYQDFVKGRFKGIALASDGRMTVGPKLDAAFASDQAVVWSVAAGANGQTWLGTGHRGRLYRLNASGQSELVFTAPEPEIFALAVDAKGIVYAATSPNGKIYRIDGSNSTTYYDPKARYIWSLAVGRDGALYAGTGDEGKIYRISAANAGEVYFESGQAHITALAVDSQGRLLAGSEPNGLLYRLTAKDKAFVLYDASHPEIRAVLPGPNDSVYVAAMGGAVAKQAQTAAGSTPAVSSTITVTSPATTITVEGANAQNPPVDVKPKQATQTATVQPAPAAAAAAPVVEYAGAEKSAIYRVNADNTVDTLWSSKDENAYDLTAEGAGLIVGTDQQGRVYRLGLDRKTTLIAETGESQIVRMAASAAGLLLATGDLGKMFRLGASAGAAGEFTSPVHDATTAARWGRFTWRGSGQVAFRVRTGNSPRPDKTWSDWTLVTNEAFSAPNSRFIQWKAELGAGASVDSVRLAYLPQNWPPVMKSVTVTAQTASAGAKLAAAAGAPAAPAFSITVTDTGEAGPSSVSGTATQPVTRASIEQLVITWAGDDPDGDKLIYTLEFRGEGEQAWKTLRANFTESTYTVDAEAFADGRYYFRVTASDRLTNPEPYARTADIMSAPILIDRTPPQLTVTSRALPEVRFTAVDSASPLKSCEYSLDAAAWVPLAPVDGIIDSPREEFVVRLTPPAGEHLLVVRCYDSANNAGVAKVVLGR